MAKKPIQVAADMQVMAQGRMEKIDRLVGAGIMRADDAAIAKKHLRHDMLALAGGYTGASKSRATLRNWSPDPVSADDEVAWNDLPTLRARSRDLVRNAPLAGAAIETATINVVGTGLSMQPAIDADALGLDDEAAAEWQAATRREWMLWCEAPECDVTRTQNFYGLQSLAFRATAESGDVFALLASIPRDNTPYTLAVQLIEADRICNQNRAANTATLVDGVQMNESGEAVAYHIANRHPVGFSAQGMTWQVIPARGQNSGRRNIIHLFDRLRPGQTRGVPMLAPVVEPLKQLGRYTDAELASAVNASIFSIFIKMDPDAFDALFDDTNQERAYLNNAMQWDGSLNSQIDSPAKAVNLLPGESIEAPEPGRPSSQFDPFVNSIISQIGARLGIPQEVLVKHFNSSYSAARAALLDAWRFWRCRRDWLATYFCQPVYEAWLEEAVSAGRVVAPGFFADAAIRRAWSRAQWVGDGPGSIDPSKEVDAAEKRIELGISTREAESILHDGVGWEIKHKQLAKERRMREADGLDPESVAGRIKTEPVRPSQPDDGA